MKPEDLERGKKMSTKPIIIITANITIAVNNNK